MMNTRGGIVLLSLLALGLSAGHALGYGHSGQPATPVYTVSQIRAMLTRRPAPWLGRTVQVHGILEGPFVFCAAARPCPPPTLGLIDDGTESVGPGRYLPVLAAPPAQPLVSLRRLPLLSRFLPAPQHLRFGLMTPYRLRLQAAPELCSRNRDVLCYEGMIEDASPL